MSEATSYYIHGFLLRVFDSAYLVEVKPANGETGYYKKVSTLPAWMFRSPHAIWLTDEDGPIADRANKGESIKQEILTKHVSF
jgi:hypothetical protein